MEVEEVATELTLDGGVDDVNLPELRLTLARLYAVPPSTITLQLAGGSVVVRVLIAGGDTTSLDEIANAISAVADETLSEAVSAALGTTVIQYTTPTTALRNVSRYEQQRCSRGHWCTAALTIEW